MRHTVLKCIAEVLLPLSFLAGRSVMGPPLLTIRHGAVLVAVHDKQIADDWMHDLRKKIDSQACVGQVLPATCSERRSGSHRISHRRRAHDNGAQQPKAAPHPVASPGNGAQQAVVSPDPAKGSPTTSSTRTWSGISSAGSASRCACGSRSVQDPAVEAQILERLAIVEEAIRLQVPTGASHLQKIEMAPEAFGLPSAVRAPVRRLRRRRNEALHGELHDKPSHGIVQDKLTKLEETFSDVYQNFNNVEQMVVHWERRNKGHTVDDDDFEKGCEAAYPEKLVSEGITVPTGGGQGFCDGDKSCHDQWVAAGTALHLAMAVDTTACMGRGRGEWLVYAERVYMLGAVV